MPRVVITVPGKNSQPYRFSLDRKVVRIGRSEDNDIVVESGSVSSHHCQMHRVDGGYTLNDMDSTNGIKLDDTRMEVIDLKNNCDIRVGDVELEFELTDEELDELAKEEHKDHEKVKLPPAGGSEPEKTAPKVEDKPEEKPRKRPAAKPAPVVPQSQSGAGNFLMTLVLLGLAILSFYLGMATRHKAQTGNSLWEALFGAPAPAEAPVEKPAES
jgi:pSer/pThr/pTyr-binding forkhead associated (FHA) protein